MKTRYYINEKKTTKKAAADLIGSEKLRRFTEEAKEGFREDPLTQQSFWIGGNRTLTIEFEF